MLSKKVSVDGAKFASPADSTWFQASSQDLDLMGVPVSMQPSVYISSTMQNRKVGKVSKVKVASLHNDNEIAFRLEWSDPDQNIERSDTNVFPDGAAIMFPVGDDAPIVTMGAEDQPVNTWHWRADRPDNGFNNISVGLGTSEVTNRDVIKTAAAYDNGVWSIVFRRALKAGSASDMKQFASGEKHKVAYAVWEGGNGERGGLKAFSPAWVEFELEQ